MHLQKNAFEAHKSTIWAHEDLCSWQPLLCEAADKQAHPAAGHPSAPSHPGCPLGQDLVGEGCMFSGEKQKDLSKVFVTY